MLDDESLVAGHGLNSIRNAIDINFSCLKFVANLRLSIETVQILGCRYCKRNRVDLDKF
jgi:NRPS condensation-like uncharacterized protein